MVREKVEFRIEPQNFAGERWSMYGWFSAPEDHAATLLVLIPGGTYTHAYWDMPYRPDVYSAVQWAYENGIATLNLDRLGVGESHRPPGVDLTLQLNAEGVDQILRHIRRDGILGRRFARIVTVGHSYGSLTASYAQATWGNADGVVLTGITGANVNAFTESDEAGLMDQVMLAYTPALGDDQMADRHHLIDDGYLRSRPEVRSALFFRVPPAEPAMVEIDDRLQDTMTVSEFATSYLGFEKSAQIEVPVLIQIGEYDQFFYDAATERDCSRTYEEAQRRNPANFTHLPLYPDTAHNLTQHPNARAIYDDMKTWLRGNDFL